MTDSTTKPSIGLLAALSIGVGGMIGAGIFSILGVVASIAGSAMPLSFAIGGVVAGLAAYSYVALGRTFPSVGGPVTFLVRGYGEGAVSGSLSLFQYFSYIITIALYATGFAAYAGTFVASPVEGVGGGRRARLHGDQLPRQPNDGPGGVRDRDRQGGDPRRLRRGGVHRVARRRGCSPVAGRLAGSSGDLHRSRGVVRWLRGLRSDHERSSQHGEPEARAGVARSTAASPSRSSSTCSSPPVW